jgi:uncharacterized membrane protein
MSSRVKEFKSNLCLSHPVHPSTVHLPLSFLLAASGLDILAHLIQNLPSLAHPIVSLFADANTAASPGAVLYYTSLFSYASTIAGILTAIPAVSSGAIEAYAMISSKGLDLNDPVIKTTVIHAVMNELAIVGALYNWFSRRNVEGFLPSGVNVLISSIMLGAVAYSGFLGGGLVYTHGVGVQRMGKGKEEKDKNIAEIKKSAKKEL